MIPFDREAGDRAQKVRLLAVIAKMFDRLLDQQLGLLPGALLAEQRDEGRLAGCASLPVRLPAAASSPL